MLNINNLNRARKILSAQQGARVSLNPKGDPEFLSFQNFVNKNLERLFPVEYANYPDDDKTNINQWIKAGHKGILLQYKGQAIEL